DAECSAIKFEMTRTSFKVWRRKPAETTRVGLTSAKSRLAGFSRDPPACHLRRLACPSRIHSQTTALYPVSAIVRQQPSRDPWKVQYSVWERRSCRRNRTAGDHVFDKLDLQVALPDDLNPPTY